jgi:hypothetical protein
MSTIAIIAIAVGVLIVLAMVAIPLMGRRTESRRQEAHELRRSSEARKARAEHERAKADEQKARARREAVEADQHRERVDRELAAAVSDSRRAKKLDPDTDS